MHRPTGLAPSSFAIQLAGALALASVAACGNGGDGDTGEPDGGGACTSCDGGGGGGGDGGDGELPATAQDIDTTALELDLGALVGRAVLIVTPASGSGVVELAVGGLDVAAVTVDGVAAAIEIEGGVLRVAALGTAAVEVAVDYAFEGRPASAFDGWMPASGVTFLWPTFCDNLFPCDPDPTDGSRFTMTVVAPPGGGVAVYPAAIPLPTPSYVPAIAVGDFEEIELGTTASGTAVSVFHLPGSAARATRGTARLVDVVGFLEETYGAYRFGPKIASVEASWGPGAYGGMEHHPYFHVAADALGSEEVNAHEAAHGWFGDGVRLACWEDFVLSEGTATYLAARAVEAAGGDSLWPGYVAELMRDCEGPTNTTALPDSCGVIDIIADPLWSTVPYMKGACFYEEVADLIGDDAVDAVLRTFYGEHVGAAARMDDLVDALVGAAGADGAGVADLADEWLRTEACPVDYRTRCGS